MDLISKAARYVAGADRNPATSDSTATVDLILNRLRNGRLPSERLQCVETLSRRLNEADRLVARCLQEKQENGYTDLSGSFQRSLALRKEVALKGCALFSAVLEQDRTETETTQSTLLLLLLLVSPTSPIFAPSADRESAKATSASTRSFGVGRSADSDVHHASPAPSFPESENWTRAWDEMMHSIANILICGADTLSSSKQRLNHNLLSTLLDLLVESEFSTRLHVSDILIHIVRYSPAELQRAVLQCPRGIARVVDLLRDPREVIRSNALRLLMELSRSNAEIQKILAFESIFEYLFEIIDAARYEEIAVSNESNHALHEDRPDRGRDQEMDAADTLLSVEDAESESISGTEQSSYANRIPSQREDSAPTAFSNRDDDSLDMTADPADYLICDCLCLMSVLLEGDSSNAILFVEAGCIPKLSSLLFLRESAAKTMRLIQAESLMKALTIVERLTEAASESSAAQIRSLCLQYGVTESVARLVHTARCHESIATYGLQVLGRLVWDHPSTLAFLHELFVPVALEDDPDRRKSRRVGSSKSESMLFVTFVYDLMSEEGSATMRAAAFCLLGILWLANDGGLRWLTRLLLGSASLLCQSSPRDASQATMNDAATFEGSQGLIAEAQQHLGHEMLFVAAGWPDTADAVAVFYTCSLLTSWIVRGEREGICQTRSQLLRVRMRGPVIALAPDALDTDHSNGEPFFMRLTRTLGRAVREASPPLVRLALLLLLCSWLYDSEQAQGQLLSVSLNIPLLLDVITTPGRRADGVLFEQIRGLATLALAECIESKLPQETMKGLSPHLLCEIVQKRVGWMRFASFLDDVRASAFFGLALSTSPWAFTSTMMEQTRHATAVAAGRASVVSATIIPDLGHACVYPSDLVAIMQPVYERVQQRLLAQYMDRAPADGVSSEEQQATARGRNTSDEKPVAPSDYSTTVSSQVLEKQTSDPQELERFTGRHETGSKDLASLRMRIRELEDMVGQLDEYKRVIRDQDAALRETKEELRVLSVSLQQSQDYADAQIRHTETRFSEEIDQLRQLLSDREDTILRLKEHVESLEQELENRQGDLESISKACEALEQENERLRSEAAAGAVDALPRAPPSSELGNDAGTLGYREEASKHSESTNESQSARTYPTRRDEVDELQMQLAEERKNVARLTILLSQFENAEREEDAELEEARIENSRLYRRVAELEQLVGMLDGSESSAEPVGFGGRNINPWEHQTKETSPKELQPADGDLSLMTKSQDGIPAGSENAPQRDQEVYIAQLEQELSSLRETLSRTEEDAYETQTTLEEQIGRLECERTALRNQLETLRTSATQEIRETGITQHARDGEGCEWGENFSLLPSRPISVADRENALNHMRVDASGTLPDTSIQPQDGTQVFWSDPRDTIHSDMPESREEREVSKPITGDQDAPDSERETMTVISASLKLFTNQLHEHELLWYSSLETMRARLLALDAQVSRCRSTLGTRGTFLAYGHQAELWTNEGASGLDSALPRESSCLSEDPIGIERLLQERMERVWIVHGDLKRAIESAGLAQMMDDQLWRLFEAHGLAMHELEASLKQILSISACFKREQVAPSTTATFQDNPEEQIADHHTTIERIQELEAQYQLVCQERDQTIRQLKALEEQIADHHTTIERIQELEAQYQLVCQERDSYAEQLERLHVVLEASASWKENAALLELTCAQLRNDLASKEETLLATTETLEQLRESHAHCDSYRTELERLREALTETQRHLEESEARMEEAAADRLRYRELEQAFNKTLHRCEVLEKSLLEVETSLESAQAGRRDQEALQARIDELVDKNEQQEAEMERLSSELIMVQDALSTREDEVRHLQNQIQNLQEALKSEQEEAMNSERQFEEMNHELEEQLNQLRSSQANLVDANHRLMEEQRHTEERLLEAETRENDLRNQQIVLEKDNQELRTRLAHLDAMPLQAVAERVRSSIEHLQDMSQQHFELVAKQQHWSSLNESILAGFRKEFESMKMDVLAALQSTHLPYQRSNQHSGSATSQQGSEHESPENQGHALLPLPLARELEQSTREETEATSESHSPMSPVGQANAMEELIRRYEHQIAELQSSHDARLRELVSTHEQVLQELELEIEQLRTAALPSVEALYAAGEAPPTSPESEASKSATSGNRAMLDHELEPKKADALQRSLIQERIRTGDLRQENIRLQALISALQTRLDALEALPEVHLDGLSLQGHADDYDQHTTAADAASHWRDEALLPRPEPADERATVDPSTVALLQSLDTSRRQVAAQRNLITQLEQQVQELIDRESRLASAIEMYHDEQEHLRARLADIEKRPNSPASAAGSYQGWGIQEAPGEINGEQRRPTQALSGAQEMPSAPSNDRDERRAEELESELWRLREEHHELLICLAEMEMECNAYKQRLQDFLLPSTA
jgi:hypothetical protein